MASKRKPDFRIVQAGGLPVSFALPGMNVGPATPGGGLGSYSGLGLSKGAQQNLTSALGMLAASQGINAPIGGLVAGLNADIPGMAGGLGSWALSNVLRNAGLPYAGLLGGVGGSLLSGLVGGTGAKGVVDTGTNALLSAALSAAGLSGIPALAVGSLAKLALDKSGLMDAGYEFFTGKDRFGVPTEMFELGSPYAGLQDSLSLVKGGDFGIDSLGDVNFGGDLFGGGWDLGSGVSNLTGGLSGFGGTDSFGNYGVDALNNLLGTPSSGFSMPELDFSTNFDLGGLSSFTAPSFDTSPIIGEFGGFGGGGGHYSIGGPGSGLTITLGGGWF